ncbi:amino acid ABC transporter permease [Yinghuangia seranimata]|uniref:amino acid ABC transporter permease n=1 Tax=Yinghuangia seranimata TaxID=408067 RepID=UPI00248BF3CB|nr:amino acid ABC transporter permease [Yinghuangia seranimata]MDI2128982.1 amino acid ABC transporter permease [Yinghuangia seranimata]
MDVVLRHWSAFTDGMTTTLELTALSFAGALLIGIVVAAMRVSPVPVLRGVGTVYVESFQNTPLLVLLVLFVFGLPEVGVIFPLFTTAVIAIALYEAAYIAEAVRSGINTVPVGQAEAARAIGLGFGQSLRLVILPQALRAVVQPIGNILIALTMNTSLAAAVGVVDLTAAANRVNLLEAQPIPVFVGAGLGYMAVCALVGLLTNLIERKVAIVR